MGVRLLSWASGVREPGMSLQRGILQRRRWHLQEAQASDQSSRGSCELQTAFLPRLTGTFPAFLVCFVFEQDLDSLLTLDLGRLGPALLRNLSDSGPSAHRNLFQWWGLPRALCDPRSAPCFGELAAHSSH